MKSQLIAIVAAVLVVGCGPSVHDAAHSGNIEAVKQHLAAGTKVDAKDDGGVTTLQYAAVGGHKEIVELLISQGADVNAKDKHGRISLHLAAAGGHKEVIELLIAEGVNVNAKNNDGRTPLDSIYHIRGGKPETFTLLRKHGGKTGEELKAEGK
ncbi:ankyrin repeat domain-containing protein [Verrucomicrobia bacterium]|nr:ankyrin repeat domain-containing protein [Verrucomicrobiota bacterium]